MKVAAYSDKKTDKWNLLLQNVKSAEIPRDPILNEIVSYDFARTNDDYI